MIKDILVVLEGNPVAAAYALSFAQRFGAEVTAVCAKGDFVIDAVASAQTRYDFILAGRAQASQSALASLEAFGRQAREAGITAHTAPLEGLDAAEFTDAPRFARCFDLVVVEQPEPGRRARGAPIAALLAESGRPLLATPYIQKAPAAFDRILVAWDASASAARALAGALPILRRARSVEVATVTDARSGEEPPRGASVLRHLARHGIAASFRTIPSEIDPGNMLLSHVADSGVELLVAGGYGHSRLGEALLGGVTRTLLESMTIPVFLAH